jgi:hypothetical protein
MSTPASRLTFLVLFNLAWFGFTFANVIAIQGEPDRTDGDVHAAVGAFVMSALISPFINSYIYHLLSEAKLPAPLFFWSEEHPNWDLIHSSVCALLAAFFIYDGIIYRFFYGGLLFVFVQTILLLYLLCSTRAGLLLGMSKASKPQVSNPFPFQRIAFVTGGGLFIGGIARLMYANIDFKTFPQLENTAEGIVIVSLFFSCVCFFNAGLMYCKRRGVDARWASTAWFLGPFNLVAIALQKPKRIAVKTGGCDEASQ